MVTATALVATTLTTNGPAYADPPIVVDLPVSTYTNPVQVTYLDPSTLVPSDVSIPVGENGSQVSTQCGTIPGSSSTGLFGQLCMGNPVPDATPPSPISGGEDLVPFVKDGDAAVALNPLVAEAAQYVRATYDIPSDTRIGSYARPEMRAYLVNRLLNIMDQDASNIILTEKERRALDFVEADQIADDRAMAQAAVDQLAIYQGSECVYQPPPAPAAVADPLPLPADVSGWCGVLHHPETTAAVFSPPIPSVEDFQTWGSYTLGEDLGLDVLTNDTVRNQTRDTVLSLGLASTIAGAIGAAALAATLAGTFTSVAFLAAGIAGSASVGGVALGSAVPGVATAFVATGVVAAASIAAIVIVALAVIAFALYLFIQHEGVAMELVRLNRLAQKSTDPFGLDQYKDDWSGTVPGSQIDPADPPSYRTGQSIMRLAAKVTQWTTVQHIPPTATDPPITRVVADPSTLWADNASTGADQKFMVSVDGGPEVATSQILVQQDGGFASVRFSRDWLIVKRPGEQERAALSFGYVGLDGKPRMAMRAPRTLGGFLVAATDTSGDLAGTHLNAITFMDAQNRTVSVRIPTTNLSGVAGPRPSAVGPLIAGRPVILRPNPVGPTGASIDPGVAQSNYDYAWTVNRLDPAAGTWPVVTTSTAFGPSFTPTQTGTYDVRVTMSEKGDPSIKKYGNVRFTIEPPPILPVVLALKDDGGNNVQVDVQVKEDVPTDTVFMRVEWPGDIGGDGTLDLLQTPCVQTDPLECTSVRTGSTNIFKHTLNPQTDLREPIKVTVSNGTGAQLTQELFIGGPGRPSFAPPTAGVNDGLPGEVNTSDGVTRVAMPFGLNRNDEYEAAVLVPSAGGSDDLQMVNPDNPSSTVTARVLPGTSLTVKVLKEDGTWRLKVEGNPRFQDIGTHQLPLVIAQNDGNRRNLIVLAVDVVPSTLDRYRAGLHSDVDPLDFFVDSLPQLDAVILGGRADFPAYTGDLCVSLQHNPGPSSPVKEKCGPRSDFLKPTGEALAFPYADLYPDGMAEGLYQAKIRLVGDANADTTPSTMSFYLGQSVTFPKPPPPPPPPLPPGTPTVGGAIPTITGTPRVGTMLSADAGTWTPATTVKSFAWLRDGAPIPGATGASYVATATDRGHRLTVRVTGTATGYNPASATSAATAPVSAGILKQTPKPKVSGTPRIGRTLTAKPGSWDAGVRLKYQWFAGARKLAGKTAKKLVLTAGMKGDRIKVRVTGVKPGYASVARKSAATAKVAAARRLVTGRPALDTYV
jgi:hypothetical protein